MQRFSKLLSLVVTLTLSSACATGPTSTPGSSSTDEVSKRIKRSKGATSLEASDFRTIELFYQKNLLESLGSQANAFIQNYPKSSYLPSVENLWGLTLLRNKAPQEAAFHFKRAIEKSANQKNLVPYILYNLATAQFDANQLDESEKTLESIRTDYPADAMDKVNRLKTSYLKASILSRKAKHEEAARELLSASRWFPILETPAQKKAFSDLLDVSLEGIQSHEILDSFLREFEDSPVADSLLFHLGSRELALSRTELSSFYLKSLLSKFPQSTYFQQATELLAKAEKTSPVESKTIGVLLPMSGRFSRFGNKTLQAIQLALGVFNPDSPDSGLTLVVEDSGEEPEQAIKALETLAAKHHVVAVIGPMLSKGIEQVAQRAQELEIPLLSIARRSIPQKNFVFHAGMNQDLQTGELINYAVQKEGLKRFVLVYPNDKVGLETAQTFWDSVESAGGSIVGIEAYPPYETDFRRVVDKLSGLFYTDARQRELDLLTQEREANHIKKRTRKTEQFFRLRPIVDFDAVFIADESKVAGQLIPTFAYRDIDHVKFLGMSSWNSPDFLARTQGYAENTVFVDGLYSGSDTLPASRRFIDDYRNTFKQEPSTMEAMAYDAALILKDALERRSLRRSDLNERLVELRKFSGATGNISYKNGILARDLRVLTVRAGKISLLP